MAHDREERIRAHAYALWEKEGRPEGRHADHWDDARAAIDGEADATADAAQLLPAADATGGLAPLTLPVTDAPTITAETAAPPPAPKPARKPRGRKTSA